jgi:hypothetical protein
LEATVSRKQNRLTTAGLASKTSYSFSLSGNYPATIIYRARKPIY